MLYVKRPIFKDIKSFAEFQKYYWYRAELRAICQKLQLSHTGNKTELLQVIEQYYAGHVIPPQKQISVKKLPVQKKLTLTSPLLACGFTMNDRFRRFFAEQTGQRRFRYTADMAAAWKKVKRSHDHEFTLGDLLQVYRGKSDYAHYDAAACQWNAFLKAFCSDAHNAACKNKIKAASILWQIVKESDQPKVYSPQLAEKNWGKIKNF